MRPKGQGGRIEVPGISRKPRTAMPSIPLWAAYVRGGDDVRAVYEGPPAEVDVVELVLLQDGNLPGILGWKRK